MIARADIDIAEEALRTMGVTARVESCFHTTIDDDPRRYFPWPSLEDLNATPTEFTRLTSD
jgi:hypothetical protein